MARITADGEVLCGILLPIQNLNKTIREPWEPDATADDLVAVAQAAEAAGLGFAGVCDHIAIPGNDYAAHMSTTWYDTIATLGFLGAATSTIRLLSMVHILPYRHTLMSAKSFTTLDRLSGGRVVMGVGAGHVEAEFQALGLNFADRGRMTNEAIDAVRVAVGAAGGFCEFSGEFWEFENMGVGPAAAQDTIPIWIGGSTRPALRRVVERGDGWIPHGTQRADMPGLLEYMRAHADTVGRDLGAVDLGWMPELIYMGERLDALIPSPRPCLTGPSDQIAESLRYAHRLGTSVLHLRFRSRDLPEYLDQLARFGAEVLPLLAD